MGFKTLADGGKSVPDLSSASLHIIAMASMLIDHSFKTVIENDTWVFALGRLAFPLFAFMAAEGYFHTRNYRKYLLRLLIFAVISEIPYNLMKNSTVFDRYDQNVIWIFLLALLCIRAIDLVKEKAPKHFYVPAAILITFIGFYLGSLSMADYGGMGVVTVLIFFFFRNRTRKNMLLQFVLLLIINVTFLGALGYGVSADIFGTQTEIPLQGFAVLALIPIWLYRGRQGCHSKLFQYFCYAFYPGHAILLYAISLAQGM